MLGVKYAVHLRLIGKQVVDLLLMLIELLAKALLANIDWKSAFLLARGQSIWPKISGSVRPDRPFFVSEN